MCSKSNISQATLAVRKHLHGQQAVSLIVDNSVSSLHIEIMGPVNEARLRAPNGKLMSNFTDRSRDCKPYCTIMKFKLFAFLSHFNFIS